MLITLQIFVLLAVWGQLNAERMVAAPVGTCTKKRAYGIVTIKKRECSLMGGRWNGSPGSYDWIACHIDWCDIPASGSVSSQYVWGFDTDQASRTTSLTRTYGIIRTTRRDCDNMGARYNGNPTSDEWVDCHLYMKRMDGKNRNNVDSIIVAGVGECSNKVAFGIIKMIQKECLINGGKWNGNPGANDWIDCHLDLCLSPVINCKPSDLWSTIQTCRNPSSSTFTCSFTLTTGIEKGQSQESTSGGHVEVSVTTEVGAELKGIFTASVSTTFTTGFEWSNTRGSHTIWTEETSRQLSVAIDPGQAVAIRQVVGTCGNFRIDTPEYRVVDVKLK